MQDLYKALLLLKSLSEGNPVHLEEIHMDALRKQMITADMRIDKKSTVFMDKLVEAFNQIVAIESLKETKQFRCWIKEDGIHVPEQDDDRYHALKIIWGEYHLYNIVYWSQFFGSEHNWYKIGKNERSRGRGLQQALADLTALVLFRDEKFLSALNRRIWAGQRKKAEDKAALDAKFEEAGFTAPRKWSLVESVPPGTLIRMVLYLLKLDPDYFVYNK